jgi:hypothetical protein
MMEKMRVFDSRDNIIIEVEKVYRTDVYWSKISTLEQSMITTEKGIEHPFMYTLNDVKE